MINFPYDTCIERLCGCDTVPHVDYIWLAEKINSMNILRDSETFH